jgi:cytochrome b subunit of formate dehydrogenase
VITGLCLWKPVQFSELAGLFGNFQNIRLIHFLCMSLIVAFVVVHITLAFLVPRSLLAMITGGPVLEPEPPNKPIVASEVQPANRNQSNAVTRWT